MGADTEVSDNSNTRGWMLKEGKRRELDVFYTNYDTKLFVDDGVLVEESLKRPRPCDSYLSYALVEESAKRSRPDDIYLSDDDFPPGCLSCDTPPVLSYLYGDDASDHLHYIESAGAALEYYNKKTHKNYKLVDHILSNAFFLKGVLCFHSNFTAKLPAKSSQEQLFFAETKLARTNSGSKYTVTSCRLLPDGRSTTQCEMCNDGILHPTQRSHHGLYGFNYRELRPRKDGKVLSEKMQ